MTTATLPGLRQLTDTELAESWHAGAVDLATLERECARRDRADRARAAARRRTSEWEAAAYAQYEQAEQSCSYLLNDAGKARGRDPWPMLWQGNEQDARRLASEELLRFWDYESPRVPPANAYAARQRAEQAEAAARYASDPPQPAPQPARAPKPAPRPAPRRASRTAPAPRPAGSMARYITALSLLERQADRTARALARVTGGVPR